MVVEMLSSYLTHRAENLKDGTLRKLHTIALIGVFLLLSFMKMANAQAVVAVFVAEKIAGQSGHVNYNTIPGVIYTTPEVASIGQTEEQLKEKKVRYRIGKFSFMANSRAKAIDEAEGFVKILADEKTDKVLGAHLIGPHAGELIAEIGVAMEFGASSEDIARTCHAHPTFSEAVKEAALSVDKRAIHS